jgi:hypothetical protein
LSFTFKVFTLAKRVILTDKAYLYYRQDNMNSSVKSKTKVWCVCDEYNEIERFMNEHPEFDSSYKTQEAILRYTGYVSSVLRIDDEVKPEFIKVFSEQFKKYSPEILNDDFFKKIDKREFNLLLNVQEKYIKLLKRIEFKKKINAIRKKIFSFHLRNGYLNITFCGKEIINTRLY